MKICNNCGAAVPDTANFCRECGAKLGVNRDFIGADQGETTALINDLEEIPEAEIRPAGEPFGEPAGEPYRKPAQEQFGEPAGEPYRKPAQEQYNEPAGEPYRQPEAPAYRYAGDGGARYRAGQGQRSGGDSPYRAAPTVDKWDHTHEFEKTDISENKVVAMLVYLLGPVGIIIALLAAATSPYAGFHVRQGLKFIVTEMLLGVITLLCYPLLLPPIIGALNALANYQIPSLGGFGFFAFVYVLIMIAWVILGILKIIAFFSICFGKAKEVPIIRGFKFMR